QTDLDPMNGLRRPCISRCWRLGSAAYARSISCCGCSVPLASDSGPTSRQASRLQPRELDELQRRRRGLFLAQSCPAARDEADPRHAHGVEADRDRDGTTKRIRGDVDGDAHAIEITVVAR